MIKTVFIHVPRTGGNTVMYQYRNKFLRFSHDRADQVKMRLGNKWDSFWKFGFVRNPWDRYVSLWYRINLDRHITLPTDLDGQRQVFKEWLNVGPLDPNYTRPDYPGSSKNWPKEAADKIWHKRNNQFIHDLTPGKMLADEDGQVMVDRVFKFESLTAAHEVIRGKLDVPYHRLPTRKPAPRTYKTHDLIPDPLDVEKIEFLGGWECREFGYKFSDARR